MKMQSWQSVSRVYALNFHKHSWQGCLWDTYFEGICVRQNGERETSDEIK